MNAENLPFKAGDRVLVVATQQRATVVSFLPDGKLFLLLEADGSTLSLPIDAVAPARRDVELHDDSGRFRDGHPKRGGSRCGWRTSRNVLMEQIFPFYTHMGEIISSIEDPYNRVRAIALMSRHVLPVLSAIDMRESVPRNLSAEEVLVRMDARFQGKPEPPQPEDGD
jgi:hypothetical protein